MSNPNKNKKRLLKTIFIANATCGCSTKSSKLSDQVIEPVSKLISNSSSTSFDVENYTSTATLSPETGPNYCSVVPTPARKVMESISVEKDSNDPYEDFKSSIQQMVVEKEIYTKNGLQELLHRFLELNSPYHHDVIVKAFTEIWNELVVSERLMIFSAAKKPAV